MEVSISLMKALALAHEFRGMPAGLARPSTLLKFGRRECVSKVSVVRDTTGRPKHHLAH